MIQHEYILQRSCIEWFRLQYPKFTLNLFSIPNSNELSSLNRARAAQNMKKLKKSGLTVGVSDLFLALPSGKSNGLFIEMKVKPNKPTDNQIKFGQAMMESGYHFEICYSFDKFVIIINNWMKEV